MNKDEVLPEDKGGGHLLYTQRSPDHQSNHKHVNITSLKSCHCGTGHVVQPHEQCQNTSWYHVRSHPWMPILTLAQLCYSSMRQGCAAWRRHLQWEWGLEPQWDRAASREAYREQKVWGKRWKSKGIWKRSREQKEWREQQEEVTSPFRAWSDLHWVQCNSFLHLFRCQVSRGIQSGTTAKNGCKTIDVQVWVHGALPLPQKVY